MNSVLVYFSMIFGSCFCAYAADCIKPKGNELTYGNVSKHCFTVILIGIAGLIPTFISGIRGISVGTDVHGTYYEIFTSIKKGHTEWVRDIGYGFINKIAIALYDDYHSVLFITSFLFCILCAKSIYNCSRCFSESFLLFFVTCVFFLSMNMIRQSLATAVCLVSIKYIEEHRLVSFFICWALAISIHTSVAVFGVLLILYYIELTPKRIILLIVITIIFRTVLSNGIVMAITKIPFASKYFAWYIGSAYNSGDINVYSLILSSVILSFLLYIYKRAHKDKQYNLFLWCMTLSVVILLLSDKIPLMRRVSWIYNFSEIIFLPNMFKYIKQIDKRIMLKICIYGMLTAYMIITVFIKGHNEVVPYVTLFDSK